MKRKKLDRIALGLAISACSMEPGQTRNLNEMAAFCDCTREAIRRIESSGLRKMRLRLQVFLDKL